MEGYNHNYSLAKAITKETIKRVTLTNPNTPLRTSTSAAPISGGARGLYSGCIGRVSGYPPIYAKGVMDGLCTVGVRFGGLGVEA